MIESLQSRLRRWLGDAALRRLAKNTSFLVGAEALGTLISLVQFPLVTRLLGPENYGAWGIAVSWVGVVGQIFSFRLWETVIRFLSQFMADSDESRALAVLKLCLLIDVVVGAVTFVVVALSADLAAAYWLRSRPDGADLIRLEALNMLMGVSMSVWIAVLRVFDRFRFISLYNVLSDAALFVMWMTALALGAGVSGLILAAAIVKLGQTLALAWRAQRELRNKFTRGWWSADLRSLNAHRRQIWVMLFSMNLDTFRKMVTANADLLILGWFATPFHVGIYRQAKQLASYLNRIFGLFYEAIYPEIPRLYTSEGAGRVRMFIRRMTLGLGAAMIAAVTVAALAGPPLIPLIFGPEYASAIPVFLILLVSNFWVLLYWAPPLLVTLGKSPQLVTINFVISVATLAALLVFTPLWFANGAALASVVSFGVGVTIYLIYFARVPGFEWKRIFLNV